MATRGNLPAFLSTRSDDRANVGSLSYRSQLEILSHSRSPTSLVRDMRSNVGFTLRIPGSKFCFSK